METIVTTKEVKQKLTHSMESTLVDCNFKLKKSNGFIIRKSKGKTENVFFRILNYWPLCQEIDYAGFSIRFDAVEEIVNPFLAKYDFFNIECTKTTATIGDSIYYNTRIDKIEDVDKFIHLHLNNIKQKVLDYFSQYDSINNANRLKKNQILTDNSGLSYSEHNLMQSLTLMKLCNDSDFGELTQKYKDLYSNWGGYEEKGINAINDLIEYIYCKMQ